MGADYRGDPASAMLEVLDPEQNAHVPRPLPRPAVRPLEGALHLHREPARDDPGAAARPDGRDPALRLHRGREARHRASATSCRSSSRRTGSTPSSVEIDGRRAAPRSSASTRARRACATSSGGSPTSCRKAARQIAEGKTRQTSASTSAACASWLGPRRFAGEVRKRTSDPGVATGLAVTAVGGDVLFIEATAYPGQGPADDHRPARRGHAGVGPGGALVGARPCGRSSGSTRTGSRSTTSTSTSRPARCRRTGRRPA